MNIKATRDPAEYEAGKTVATYASGLQMAAASAALVIAAYLGVELSKTPIYWISIISTNHMQQGDSKDYRFHKNCGKNYSHWTNPFW